MRICYGWAKSPLALSTTLRYHPEQIINMIGRLPPEVKAAFPLVLMPLWLLHDGLYVRLDDGELELACKLVCIDHNWYHEQPYYDEESEPRQAFSEEEPEEEEESDECMDEQTE